MAPDWLHGLHRGHRAGRVGGAAVPDRAARVEVWDRQPAAVVSASLLLTELKLGAIEC